MYLQYSDIDSAVSLMVLCLQAFWKNSYYRIPQTLALNSLSRHYSYMHIYQLAPHLEGSLSHYKVLTEDKCHHEY